MPWLLRRTLSHLPNDALTAVRRCVEETEPIRNAEANPRRSDARTRREADPRRARREQRRAARAARENDLAGRIVGDALQRGLHRITKLTSAKMSDPLRNAFEGADE